MANKLKDITYLTFKELKSNEIVLPSTYSRVFEKHATVNEVDFEDENVILKDLRQDCDRLNTIVNKTNDNINSLKSSTTEARDAIVNKDEKKLLKITNDLTNMQSKIEYLQKELFSDSLTKALNRKWLEDYYVENGTFPENGTLVFIDLNKFKAINDNYGHLIGDQVLKYLVKFLENSFDSEESNVVRFAGDEFIVLFNEEASKKYDIPELIESVRKELETKRLKTTRVNNIQFSFSYGIVEFSQNDSLEDILEKADKLMYADKQENR